MSTTGMTEKMTVGVFSPGEAVTPERIQAGLEVLQRRGIRVVQAPNLFARHRFYAGTVAQRVDDIHFLLKQDSVQVLYASRGGSGGLQLLPHVDFEWWRKRPRPLVGFSDVTALQWALWEKAGVPSISGMTLTTQLREENPFLDFFFSLLSGKATHLDSTLIADASLTVLQAGEAHGVLLGGTLSMICSLLGTPYFPRTENLILFLEDVNEPLYRIERFLMQLKLAGVLDRTVALLLGQFLWQGKSLNIEEAVREFVPGNLPVVAGFPYSHVPHSCPLPLGVPARLKTEPFSLTWEPIVANW